MSCTHAQQPQISNHFLQTLFDYKAKPPQVLFNILSQVEKSLAGRIKRVNKSRRNYESFHTPVVPLCPSNWSAQKQYHHPTMVSMFTLQAKIPFLPKAAPMHCMPRSLFANASSLLNFSKFVQDRVNVLKCIINFIPDLSTRENDFSGDKNEQHNFRLLHSVNEPRKQFRLVT